MGTTGLSGPTQGYRWVILTIATIAQATACMFAQSIGAIGSFIKDDLQLNATQVGLLVSASQVVPIVGLLIAGELLDRFSERLIVGIGTTIVGLSLLAGSLTSSYAGIALCLIVVGAG